MDLGLSRIGTWWNLLRALMDLRDSWLKSEKFWNGVKVWIGRIHGLLCSSTLSSLFVKKSRQYYLTLGCYNKWVIISVNLRNPLDNFDKSRKSSFTTSIDLLTFWQGKAIIGLGSHKNNPRGSLCISCKCGCKITRTIITWHFSELIKKKGSWKKMLQGKHKRQSPGLGMCLMQVGIGDWVYGCTRRIKKSWKLERI